MRHARAGPIACPRHRQASTQHRSPASILASPGRKRQPGRSLFPSWRLDGRLGLVRNGGHAALLDLLPRPQRAHRPPQLAGGVAQPRAQAGLRRGDRRRWRARPRDRLLSRQAAWHHQRRRARAGLAGRRQYRPQHHDLPLQLSLRRERGILRPCAEALGRPQSGAELQRHVQPAWRHDAGPQRPRCAGRPAAHPRQPAQRRRQ